MMDLSEMQSGAINELMNISIGRAASSLNQLVNEEILLTAPRVLFIKRVEASKKINSLSLNGSCAVFQAFSGPFAGDALLIFPENKSVELVRAIIGEVAPLETLTELEHDALTEVANIVLNASLGSLANLLEIEISCSLPEYVKGNGESIFMLKTGSRENVGMAMFMEVDFVLKQRKINGYVVFVLDVDTTQKFLDLID
ncbi:MAG TPA: chemotaxis protein CheC, partial [Rhodospirillales bacterium]|nr:chemotaxis protein CheC [Rhodospirillales bacterium]